MAQFPRTEPEIDQLATDMIGGFENNAEEFPSPPVALDQFRESLEAYREARRKAKDAAAAAKSATREKDEILKALVANMKTNLRYVENTCGYHHATLKSMGWGGRRPKKPMEVPGQVGVVEILKEGPGWIALRWRKPDDGGDVRAYRVERCKLGGERWEIAGMSTSTKARIENQERGVTWMYRVIAVNAVGEGRESATAEAVL